MRQTPNAASVAIFSGPHVLLIQRARPPYQGYWTLPGGRLEAGEDAQTAARREIFEEVGLSLDALIEVTVQMSGGFAIAVFTALLRKGAPVVSSEIADWCWIDPGAMSGLKTTPGLAGILSLAQDKHVRD